MFCGNCGAKIDDKTKFCPYCGAKCSNENGNAIAATENSENSLSTINGSVTKEIKEKLHSILSFVKKKCEMVYCCCVLNRRRDCCGIHS